MFTWNLPYVMFDHSENSQSEDRMWFFNQCWLVRCCVSRGENDGKTSQFKQWQTLLGDFWCLFDPLWNQASLIYPHYTILFKASLNGHVTKMSLSSCLPLWFMVFISSRLFQRHQDVSLEITMQNLICKNSKLCWETTQGLHSHQRLRSKQGD